MNPQRKSAASDAGQQSSEFVAAKSVTDADYDYWQERHRYVLKQIQTSNESSQKTLAIFQTLATAISSGVVAILVGYKNWQMDVTIANTAVNWLGYLFSAVSLFSVALIVVEVVNWFHYRREECAVVDRLTGSSLRKPPQLGNLYRWSETYIVLIIFGVNGLFWIAVTTVIKPAIQ